MSDRLERQKETWKRDAAAAHPFSGTGNAPRSQRFGVFLQHFLWLFCTSVLSLVCWCVCVRARARVWEGVALLPQSSLSARFFNFTAHFPLMSFSHTHPLIFIGNRQAAPGLR